MRFESQPPPRFDPPKSKTYVEFRSSKSMEAIRGYDNRSRYERPAPTGPPPASITRRVVQEVANTRRDVRPTPPSPPHRERDDRRVVERVREDRYLIIYCYSYLCTYVNVLSFFSLSKLFK